MMASGGKRKGTSTEKISSVRVSQGTFSKTLLKRTLTALVSMFAIILALYVVIAATWMRAIPTFDSVTLVKNNTFPGGVVPVGETVLVSPGKKIETGLLGNLKSSFIPQKNVLKVEVLAGPVGKVTRSGSGVVTVDGKVLPIKFTDFDPTNLSEDPEQAGFLVDTYLAVCVGGDCELNSPVAFTPDNIYGIPLSKSDFDKNVGLEELEPQVNQADRPAAEDVTVWVKFSNEKLSDKQALCQAKLFVASPLSNDMLSYVISQSIAGKSSELSPDDSTLVTQIKASEEFKACANEGKKGSKN